MKPAAPVTKAADPTALSVESSLSISEVNARGSVIHLLFLRTIAWLLLPTTDAQAVPYHYT
jgi:hypothetical protein